MITFPLTSQSTKSSQWFDLLVAVVLPIDKLQIYMPPKLHCSPLKYVCLLIRLLEMSRTEYTLVLTRSKIKNCFKDFIWTRCITLENFNTFFLIKKLGTIWINKILFSSHPLPLIKQLAVRNSASLRYKFEAGVQLEMVWLFIEVY